MRRFTEIAPGVLVATAELFRTTTTVASGPAGRCVVIDPAVTVSELAALAAELAATGLRPQAGFATHPHWDHVLWGSDLGDVPRYAAPRAVATATAERAGLVSGEDSDDSRLTQDWLRDQHKLHLAHCRAHM
jgi:glyoxylase-like metal-dependent hydrolase (beta-lactamase superfamily II)